MSRLLRKGLSKLSAGPSSPRRTFFFGFTCESGGWEHDRVNLVSVLWERLRKSYGAHSRWDIHMQLLETVWRASRVDARDFREGLFFRLFCTKVHLEAHLEAHLESKLPMSR